MVPVLVGDSACNKLDIAAELVVIDGVFLDEFFFGAEAAADVGDSGVDVGGELCAEGAEVGFGAVEVGAELVDALEFGVLRAQGVHGVAFANEGEFEGFADVIFVFGEASVDAASSATVRAVGAATPAKRKAA